MKLDPADPASVLRHLLCSESLQGKKRDLALMVVRGYAMIAQFAAGHSWQHFLNPPLFSSVEIFLAQGDLWDRVKILTESPDEVIPTDGLSAALCSGRLLAVAPETYAQVRHEYAAIDQGWSRLLAHEIAHELHLRIVGSEEKMGPKWFFEGFALHAAGQDIATGTCMSATEALEAAKVTGRGAYTLYLQAFEFFLARHDLRILLARAACPGFEAWLEESGSG